MPQKNEVNEITEKAIRKGGILAKLYFDMQSKDSEELQPLMSDLVNERLLKSPGVMYGFGSIDNPILIDGTYSTNAIVTVLFNDLGALINVVFNLSPVAIEVLKPQGDYVIKAGHLNTLLLSLSQISMDYSRYILTKVLKGEDLERINKELKIREEMAKKALAQAKSGELPKEKPPED